MADPIITVGVTETDGYGNLWVTPQGGGDKVKIAAKRKQLHPLFQQGRAGIADFDLEPAVLGGSSPHVGQSVNGG